MLFPPLLAPLVRGSCVLSSSKSISPSGSLKRCELLISKLNVKHYTYPEFKSETLSSILATWSTSGLARARNIAHFKRFNHPTKKLRFQLTNDSDLFSTKQMFTFVTYIFHFVPCIWPLLHTFFLFQPFSLNIVYSIIFQCLH